MTPRALRYAEEIAPRHGVRVSAIFSSESHNAAITAARWELWKRLADDGLTYSQIAPETGHDRASVYYAYRKAFTPPLVRPRPKPRPKPEPTRRPPASEEGLRIVQANIAAMQAKHLRELASRY